MKNSEQQPIKHRQSRHQHGLSLIEVMVAMAIGVILMLGIMQVFSASRATFSANEGLARVQENGRFALGFLRDDLRMAGHMGCMNELGYPADRFFNHLLPPTAAPSENEWPYRLDLPVQVYEFTGSAPGGTMALPETRAAAAAGAWSPPLPTALAGEAFGQSDVIVVRYLSADSARLAGLDYTPNSEAITPDPADAWYVQAGSIYGITDCKNLSVFQVNAGGSVSQGGRNQRGWDAAENNYSAFNQLHRYRFAAYFVGAGAGDGAPALMRMELGPNGGLGTAEELVPGVESLQVVLGVNENLRGRTAGDVPDAYVTGTQVEGGTGASWAASTPAERWASVVSMRVGMLVRHNRAGALEAPLNSPIVADTIITVPDDGRMRQTYEAQITIRNRARG